MRRRLLFLAVIAVLSLAVAGCGPKKVSIEATMTDFKFEPTSWTVPAGSEVTLTLTNDGTQEHEWVLFEAGYKTEAPFGDEDEGHIYWEGETQPGETQTFTFTAPSEPGEYQIVCGIAGHLEQGMEGTLTVTK